MELDSKMLLPLSPYSNIAPRMGVPSALTAVQPEKSAGPVSAVPAVNSGTRRVSFVPATSGDTVTVRLAGTVTEPNDASAPHEPSDA